MHALATCKYSETNEADKKDNRVPEVWKYLMKLDLMVAHNVYPF